MQELGISGGKPSSETRRMANLLLPASKATLLLQSTYLNTCVPTSSFPIFQKGLGTGGISRPVCWWRWGVEALGGRILTTVLVPGSSHPSLPQTIHLLVPGLVEDKKVKEVISRCDSGDSQ